MCGRLGTLAVRVTERVHIYVLITGQNKSDKTVSFES